MITVSLDLLILDLAGDDITELGQQSDDWQ